MLCGCKLSPEVYGLRQSLSEEAAPWVGRLASLLLASLLAAGREPTAHPEDDLHGVYCCQLVPTQWLPRNERLAIKG